MAEVVMLVGSYQLRTEVSRRLLALLPPVLVLPGDAWDSPLVQLLADEIVRDEPGQEVVLDRLLDLLVIAVLRAWFSRPDAEAPDWYRAHGDPVVGRALRMLYNNPAHPWTVASLAAETGVSRAALARRFTELVGEPPMTFLTGWRLALAADLLREPGASVGAVANGWGTARPSRSAPRSNGYTASAPTSIGLAPPLALGKRVAPQSRTLALRRAQCAQMRIMRVGLCPFVAASEVSSSHAPFG